MIKPPAIQDAPVVTQMPERPGLLESALLEALPFKFHLTGLDLSPRMIEDAKRRFTSAGARFDLYCRDVSSLPLGGEKFDLVMCGHLLEHLPDPLDGMRRMAEGLRPGAILLAIVTRPGRLGSLIHLRYRNQCIVRASRHSLSRLQLAQHSGE